MWGGIGVSENVGKVFGSVLECKEGDGKCGERCVGMRTRVGGR